jgi:hypothetical protein
VCGCIKESWGIVSESILLSIAGVPYGFAAASSKVPGLQLYGFGGVVKVFLPTFCCLGLRARPWIVVSSIVFHSACRASL